ncbi:glycosyltransferase family 2 protein [Elusimicrobiota bacterium]
MAEPMKVTLLMPTLNEIEGLRLIMPRIDRKWVDEILVIDGGSEDGTPDYSRELGCRVIMQKSRGISGAYREAVPEAKGDVIIAFSPDNNSVPERIPDLIAKMKEGYDMVIVSRYTGGAKSEDDDFLTGIGNWMFTTIINLFFGGRYTDTLVMFRAWRKEIMPVVPEFYPRAGLETYLSIQCAKRKLKVAEIPGDEPARIGSARKMNPLLNGIDVSKLIIREFFSK